MKYQSVLANIMSILAQQESTALVLANIPLTLLFVNAWLPVPYGRVVNFPLWIAAKRISAGLPLPAMHEVYKGSGSLYLAMGPMTIVEDGSTSLVARSLRDSLNPTLALLVSASASGAAGAMAVGSQERHTMRARTKPRSRLCALR